MKKKISSGYFVFLASVKSICSNILFIDLFQELFWSLFAKKTKISEMQKKKP